jgi:hypothetical protein
MCAICVQDVFDKSFFFFLQLPGIIVKYILVSMWDVQGAVISKKKKLIYAHVPDLYGNLGKGVICNTYTEYLGMNHKKFYPQLFEYQVW